MGMIQFLLAALFILQTNAFGAGKTSTFSKLRPILDPTNPTRFAPPEGLDKNSFKKEYYAPIETILRAGPVPGFIRTFQSDKYDQAILRYMYESRSTDLLDAQANMDAFFAAPDVWTEQKLLEKSGKREVYNYGVAGKPTAERIILSSGWAFIVLVTFGRVFWQLAHGNRNLF